MASSEKAGALKNAFVNAIADELGGEAMAQAGAMENAKLAGKLGLDVGNQASVTFNIDDGMKTSRADGLDEATAIKNGKSVTYNMPGAGDPLEARGKMPHQKVTTPMTRDEFKKSSREVSNREGARKMSAAEAQAIVSNAFGTKSAAAHQADRNDRNDRRQRFQSNMRHQQMMQGINRPRTLTPNYMGGYNVY